MEVPNGFLRLGVLSGVPFHRLLENYFLWILAKHYGYGYQTSWSRSGGGCIGDFLGGGGSTEGGTVRGIMSVCNGAALPGLQDFLNLMCHLANLEVTLRTLAL